MTYIPGKVSVVLPAYEEAESIGDIVRKIRSLNAEFEIIVVDDGSKDDTGKVAKEAGADIVLRNTYNLGNGASVKRGCLASAGEMIVMLDADGQHPPELIPDLLSHIGDYDMCVAARTRRSSTSKFRNFGNQMLNYIASWIIGKKIEDLTSGFRAVRRAPLMQCIHLFPQRYSYPTTITMALFQGNYFVKYMSADSITKRETGTSNISPFWDFIRFINIMFRIIILFSPQRFFLPLSGVVFAAAMALAVYQTVFFGGLQSGSLLLFMTSIFVFCFGLLAEQISQVRKEQSGYREHE